MLKNKKGKLIVIDGIDGSGKATQVKFLVDKLRKLEVKVKTIDFPRYYDNFFGKLIGEYLSGAYGDFIQTDPRVASVLYAADRFESSRQIKQWLARGYTVIADRYVSANQIHQGGKISDPKKRQNFLTWLDELEHCVFQAPRPDLVIYLDVPFEVSKEWLKQKIAKRKKGYLKGRKDVAEDNLFYLKNSRASALALARQNKNWVKIECCRGTVCLLPEEVHKRVFQLANEVCSLKKLKVKKIDPEAKLPSYAHPGDAGMDLFALEQVTIKPGQIGWIRSGIAMEIPAGYVGLCWDKSGLSHKFGLKVLGGVIDAGFRGELVLSLINLSRESYTFAKYDKVMQLLIQPVTRVQIQEVAVLSDTSRGHNGWGSTGK